MAQYVKVLDLAARTASATSATFSLYEKYAAAHVVVDITSLSGVNVVPKIFGYDQVSGKSYLILAGSVLTSTGTTVLKVGPEFTAGANIAKDYMPANWYVDVTVSGGTGATFSVGASIM